MKANLLLGPTSIQSLPSFTTGQLFLHSWRHFFGLHLSVFTIAIRVRPASSPLFDLFLFFLGGMARNVCGKSTQRNQTFEELLLCSSMKMIDLMDGWNQSIQTISYVPRFQLPWAEFAGWSMLSLTHCLLPTDIDLIDGTIVASVCCFPFILVSHCFFPPESERWRWKGENPSRPRSGRRTDNITLCFENFQILSRCLPFREKRRERRERKSSSLRAQILRFWRRGAEKWAVPSPPRPNESWNFCGLSWSQGRHGKAQCHEA